MLGELQCNGRTSCTHVNNIHIKELSRLNGQNGHHVVGGGGGGCASSAHRAGSLVFLNGPAADRPVTQHYPQIVMRNPKLFYEAAFISRPKLQDAINLRNSRSITRQQLQQLPQQAGPTPVQKVTAYSPPSSSTGTGTTGSGVSTPDSLKGNLRNKDVSIERMQQQRKKHVQFDLQLYDIKKCNHHHNNGNKNTGLSEISFSSEEEDDEDNANEGEFEDEFDEVEKSLMHGFSEYDIAAGGGGGLNLTAGHRHSSKKPNLRLDFGFTPAEANKLASSSAFSSKAKGERIDAELPLDQQTWYFGAISRTEAEEILRNCSEGCYIVRACELAPIRRDYSLAIKSSCGFMHLRVHRQADDLYRLADFNRVFVTVPDLIEYYSSEKLPIRGAEYTILRHPVHQQLL